MEGWDDGPREIDARPITLDDGRSGTVVWTLDDDGRTAVSVEWDGWAVRPASLYVGADAHAAREAYEHAGLLVAACDDRERGPWDCASAVRVAYLA